ncbi:MAG TPA: hypothetical protein VI006_20880, partial [Solirubrobacteraceae bacterium]
RLVTAQGDPVLDAGRRPITAANGAVDPRRIGVVGLTNPRKEGGSLLTGTPAGAGTGTVRSGAHLGSGVDVQSFRRIRDQFIDLQYRGQNTNFGEWTARATALDQAESTLSEPGENGINQQLSEFWDAWSDLANANGSDDVVAAKQAVVEKGAALADAFKTVRAQIGLVQSQTYAEYADVAGPAGEIAQISKDIADLNDTIKRYITTGDVPNDLLDRRDLLLDQLSECGQISVEGQADGTINVSFVDKAAAGTTYPIVTGTTAWAGPPAGGAWSPGGRLGALLEVSKPGGTLDGYLNTLDTIATNLALAVSSPPSGACSRPRSPSRSCPRPRTLTSQRP